MATKKCTNCGSELSEDTRFCSVCGTPVIAETAQEAAPEASPEQSPAAEQPSSPTPMEPCLNPPLRRFQVLLPQQ